ncbi:hypothetical protein HDV01_007056 [Terramyces sp. JEL0728]|nr:hypothetical protein HDV01_007056 [Terramyces sp. JEL0728]
MVRKADSSGGQNWNGPTCCVAGANCAVSNQYYSQCLPGSNPVPTNVPPVTTSLPHPTVAPSTDNPFYGATGFINPEFVAQVQSSIANDSSIAAMANKVASYSTAIWMDTMVNLARLSTGLQAAAKQAAQTKNNITVQFVVYDLPGRDCHALASNGEIPIGGIDTYKAKYIDVIVETLKANFNPNVRVVLIIEPDSLPNIATNVPGTEKCVQAQQGYEDGVAYALSQLSLPNVWQYVDAAHGGWLGWPNNQQLGAKVFQRVFNAALALNPKTKIAGFATSVSNYSPFNAPTTAPAKADPLQNNNGQLTYEGNPCIDENIYTQQLATVFGPMGLPTRFIVDTGRSGQAGIRTNWGSWCNVKGAGIGPRPQANPSALIDAFVWIKPPGESDGVSGPPGAPRLDGFCDPTTSNGIDSLPGAPQAGDWFHDEFVMLLKNANPPLV